MTVLTIVAVLAVGFAAVVASALASERQPSATPVPVLKRRPMGSRSR